MTLHSYLVAEFAKEHERRMYHEIRKMLRRHFKDEDDAILIGNIYLLNDFDALLIKKDAIIIIEMKDYGGIIEGDHNGPWRSTDPKTNVCTKIAPYTGSTNNPYAQVKKYKFNLLGKLREKIPLVFNEMKSKEIIENNLIQISGIVVFGQKIQTRIELDAVTKKWLRITDLDNFIATVSTITTDLEMTQEEMFKLKDQLIPNVLPEIILSLNEKQPTNVERMVASVVEDEMLLDVIYQWASVQTSMTAMMNGYTIKPGYIVENLATRYDVSKTEANNIINKVKSLAKEFGFIFETVCPRALIHNNFDTTTKELRNAVCQNGILEKGVEKRFNAATKDEQYIVWLYQNANISLEKKDDISRDLEEFLSVLNATFGITKTRAEVTSALQKIGVLNLVDWANAKRTKEERYFVKPEYVDKALTKALEKLELPDLIDVDVYLDGIEKDHPEDLAILEDIINQQLCHFSKSTTSISTRYESDQKERFQRAHGIIGHFGDEYAINARIIQQLSDSVIKIKEQHGDVWVKVIDNIFQTLQESYARYLVFSGPAHIKGNCQWIVEWVEGEQISRTLFVLAPWLTVNQLAHILNGQNHNYLVLVVVDSKMPRVMKICQEYSRFMKREYNYAILDLSMPKQSLIECRGEKPPLLDSFHILIQEAIKK